MNILVVGCGKVGSRLATVLAEEGHMVSVVDRSEERLESLPDDFDGMKTCGVPIDQDVLREAGIENCDALAAVSSDDNVNIMVSQVAKKIFGIQNVVTRIYTPDREDVFSHFGLSTVCPTHLTVSAIHSAVVEHDLPRMLNIGSHTMKFSIHPVPRALVGMAAFAYDPGEHSSLFAVLHEDDTMSLNNNCKEKLKATDRLVISTIVD